MIKTLYLIRHCSAAGQEPDAPLTEEGARQAEDLANWLTGKGIESIISSPYSRAYNSILPFSQRQGLTIHTDDRLVERALCAGTLPDWRDRLAETFEDLDLRLQGGETSRAAMARASAVVNEAISGACHTIILVTHGNLLTLLLKHFDGAFGFEDWQRMTNPDVYKVAFLPDTDPVVQRIKIRLTEG